IVVQVPPKLLVIPLLLAVGCVVVLGRITVAALRSRRATSTTDRGEARAGGGSAVQPASRTHPRRSMVWYLGWRRIVRESAIVPVLAGAPALPIALATYGDAVPRWVQATIDGEAQLIVGTDVVVTLKQRVPLPPVFRGRATEVLRLTGVQIN